MTVFDSLQPEYKEKRKRAKAFCLRFNRDPSAGHLKQLKKALGGCGEHVFIESGFHCDYGEFIHLGDRVFININCTILDAGKVCIGDDTLIGPNVQILAVSHPVNPEERRQKINIASPVTIGSNVWIGAGAIILPGVVVGNDAIIAAGSVVTKSVKENTSVAGNPAKTIIKKD